MRLIDANDLWSDIMMLPHNGDMISSEEAEQAIKDAPTVDAVEVAHGRWIVCGDGEYVPFMCSHCGKTTSWYHAQTANYCPNCGADMRGDGND